MGLIWTIIVGLIVGAIARFLMPGDQKMGWIMTGLLGICGARWRPVSSARHWAGTRPGRARVGSDRWSAHWCCCSWPRNCAAARHRSRAACHAAQAAARPGGDRASPRCAPRAPAGRTSTRCRAQFICGMTCTPRRCPRTEAAPAEAARSAHQPRQA